MTQVEATVSSQDVSSTMLLTSGKSNRVSSKEIKEALEKGDIAARAQALQHLIRLHLNGESQNHMIMTIIKFLTPVDDHLIKKLVLYFWEVVDKTDKDGNLLSVIILICSFLRNDLQHPNEFVRGLTLRFLCKIKEKDLLEPLISAVVANMTHRVTYVRRNAVLAVTAIYRRFPDLLPDAPESVETFIREESDVTSRRNAFDMLAEFAPDRAARYLLEFREQQADFTASGSGFLLSVVDFCQKMIRGNPYDKAKYVPILFAVLQAKSSSVRYQCAATLLDLSSSPTAIKEATLTFIDILKNHSDNNVRLIVLDQLDRMRARYLTVLQSSLLDLLSVLQNGSLEICHRVVQLSVELINSKNVGAFTGAMRRELNRASQSDLAHHFGVDASNITAYQHAVIKAVKTAVLRFPSCAPGVLPALMDYVTVDLQVSRAVVEVVKEVTEMQPQLRTETTTRLMELMPSVSSPAVMQTIVWMLGAHLTEGPLILKGLQALRTAVEPLPLTPPLAVLAAKVNKSSGDAGGSSDRPAMRAVTSVREDGAYVTTYVAESNVGGGGGADGALDEPTAGLRVLLCRGEHFLATVVASACSKLITQLFWLDTIDEATKNTARSEALVLLEEVLRYGTQAAPVFPMNESAQEHMRLCIKAIQQPRMALLEAVVKESRMRLTHATKREGAILSDGAMRPETGARAAAGGDGAPGSRRAMIAVDAPLAITQLGTAAGKDAIYEMEAADEAATSEAAAAENRTSGDAKADAFLKKLEETIPLSGFEEDVYCEASITVNQFDVQVDWLLVNQIDVPLENVTIELMSLGGMRLCERPQSYTIEPRGTLKTRTSLKVSATATGFIYGNVLYDVPGRERCCIILSDIHVDIMTYVRPAACLPGEFRSKWGAFDWENKVNVTTNKHDLREYIALVARQLNMKLVDPLPAEHDEELNAIPLITSDDEDTADICDFISCNLYARTVFGEDALANVSLERGQGGVLSGMVRVRSNTQTIAYGLGEKLIALQQKGKL